MTTEESALFDRLDLTRLPRHIAVIMDGNGRWAQRRHLPRIAGHSSGTKSARLTIETCARLKIEALTLYAFSVENWRRPKAEIDFLMQLLREYLRKEMPLLQKNNIRMKFLGRIHELPAGVQNDVRDATEQTAGNQGMTLCVALNYGGRAEIVDAVNNLIAEARTADSLVSFPGSSHDSGSAPPRDIQRETFSVASPPFTEAQLSRHLYTAGLPDPDLLIRTSGEMRVSNFLLWQIAYAEIFVTDTLWPDFNRARLLEALVEFQKRDRRYGGVREGAAQDSDAQESADRPGSGSAQQSTPENSPIARQTLRSAKR